MMSQDSNQSRGVSPEPSFTSADEAEHAIFRGVHDNSWQDTQPCVVFVQRFPPKPTVPGRPKKPSLLTKSAKVFAMPTFPKVSGCKTVKSQVSKMVQEANETISALRAALEKQHNNQAALRDAYKTSVDAAWDYMESSYKTHVKDNKDLVAAKNETSRVKTELSSKKGEVRKAKAEITALQREATKLRDKLSSMDRKLQQERNKTLEVTANNNNNKRTGTTTTNVSKEEEEDKELEKLKKREAIKN